MSKLAFKIPALVFTAALVAMSTSPVAYEAIPTFKAGWTEFFIQGPTKSLQDGEQVPPEGTLTIW